MASCLTCRFCTSVDIGPCAGSLWCFLRSRRVGSGSLCFDFQQEVAISELHHLQVNSGVRFQNETKVAMKNGLFLPLNFE